MFGVALSFHQRAEDSVLEFYNEASILSICNTPLVHIKLLLMVYYVVDHFSLAETIFG